MSGDGRFIAFPSFAPNLVPDDTNLSEDVFVHDRQTGSTTRVSVATGGAQGNGASSYPAISADGRFVAFDSLASNLVPGDTNGAGDVFVHDRVTGTTARGSVAADGSQGNGASSGAAISGDGQFVAFSSEASNLVPGDTDTTVDVFVRDTTTEVTTRVSVATGVSQVGISADGRFVLFYAGVIKNSGSFLHDRQTGTTSRVVAGIGIQASLSASGRYVAFATSVGVVPDDTNGHTDVFVRDLETETTVRASVASDGTQANSFSGSPSVSADGRAITFVSNASNLVSGDTNGASDGSFTMCRQGSRRASAWRVTGPRQYPAVVLRP